MKRIIIEFPYSKLTLMELTLAKLFSYYREEMMDKILHDEQRKIVNKFQEVMSSNITRENGVKDNDNALEQLVELSSASSFVNQFKELTAMLKVELELRLGDCFNKEQASDIESSKNLIKELFVHTTK